MFRKFIESREQHYYSRDRQRESFAFEWGADLLGISANGNAAALLHEFTAEAVRSSDAFYAYPPASGYSFKDGILKFPSGIRTQYSENNTVWARVFEGDSDLGMVVLPQWNCDWEGHVKLCRLLQQAGVTSVRLSMPYHHHRKPPNVKRPEYMVSPNIGQTLQATRQAVWDTRMAADWLLARGCKRLAILGTSLGSCVAFLALAHDERFSAGVFIHASSYFADVVWNGLSTQHVRKSLEGRIEPSELRHLWSPISPFPFIKRLHGTQRRILMFAGRYDPTFLPHLSQQAFDEIARHDIPHELHWLSCGHYTIGRFPFNAVVAQKTLRFIRRVARAR
jgi:prolyl oligopeptidase family protein